MSPRSTSAARASLGRREWPMARPSATGPVRAAARRRPPRPLRGGLAAGVRDLDAELGGAGAAACVDDARQRRLVVVGVEPDAAMGDAAAALDMRRLDDDQARAGIRQHAEMGEMPVGRRCRHRRCTGTSARRRCGSRARTGPRSKGVNRGAVIRVPEVVWRDQRLSSGRSGGFGARLSSPAVTCAWRARRMARLPSARFRRSLRAIEPSVSSP